MVLLQGKGGREGRRERGEGGREGGTFEPGMESK